VLLGLEWQTGEFGRQWAVLPPLVALLPVAAAILLLRATSDRTAKGALPALLGWVLLGALPVAAVATIWSAYYYLFALAGAAALVGVLLRRSPRWAALAAVVFFAWSSQAARNVEEFASAPGYWSAQSRVNLRYYQRATALVAGYLGDLRLARPEVPHTSTFFFSNIPSYIGWQSGEGSLVRWAYRDTSLRAYYLADLSYERAHRGPRFFFMVNRDQLMEWSETEDQVAGVITGMTLAERWEPARDFLRLQGESSPLDSYRLAWLEWASGDSLEAIDLLAGTGMKLDRGPAPEFTEAWSLWEAGEREAAKRTVSDGITEHVLDAALHFTLAPFVYVERTEDSSIGVLEALAARLLEPTSAQAWRQWGLYQSHAGRHVEAARSMERYFEYGGAEAQTDREAQRILAEGRDRLPGGEGVQRGLRE
jgi:hypothetical protein